MNPGGTLGRQLLARMESAQNRDGGWGYGPASSWTEPTSFALLSLSVAGPASDRLARGISWLLRKQRADGGWSPHPSVDQSTWVTSLAVWALARNGPEREFSRGVEWLLRQSGAESALLARIRRFLLGVKTEVGDGTTGWPWVPGTAGWVMPSALAVLALEQAATRRPDAALTERAQMGKGFLLARICSDGGWNHGASRALGYDAASYPETTGVALLALHGNQSAQVERAIAKAERQLADCRSVQGRAWLTLGLLAHGRRPAKKVCTADIPCRNVLDASLAVLAGAAQEGNHILCGRC